MDFKEVEIFEISVVTVPANPQATIDNIKGFDMSVVDKANRSGEHEARYHE
ncbi:HK97 family phage prohead protease [Streptococcus pneumoniae]